MAHLKKYFRVYIFIYLETRATSSESLSQLLNSKNDFKSHVPSYTSKEKNDRWKCDSNPKLLLLPVIKQSFGLKMERYKHTFWRKRKQVMTAAIAHWNRFYRSPFCGPVFESRAQLLHFSNYLFVFFDWKVKRMKVYKKRPGLVLFNKTNNKNNR